MYNFCTCRLYEHRPILSRFGCLRKLDVLSSQEILLEQSNLVEVYKDGLDLSLGNALEQFLDFVIAFKDEQAEDVSLNL